ncbi:hypothetical protein AC4HA13_0009 [Escherichia phage vB_EcoM_4HA13]|uniref:Uncharacterized protein n=1 Tax=Escherichia phage vB_EcoM_4HA13 TaxID=2601675 RepID=A0A7D0N8T0_9CAUD|nr:hypothetical protein HYP96_gp09 [Escherichia phage vB_EcoM_4HA13]QEM42980.1 hypothetical protein AC4HA13_0009 [Escherichia phage vB_EcoM_4HA13]
MILLRHISGTLYVCTDDYYFAQYWNSTQKKWRISQILRSSLQNNCVRIGNNFLRSK